MTDVFLIGDTFYEIMQEIQNFDDLNFPQIREALTPGTVVYVTDGCHGDTSSLTFTPDLPSPTFDPQFDIIKAAALMAGIPVDEGGDSFPSPDASTFDQPLSFTDDDLEVNYVPKETERDQPSRHGTKRKREEREDYPMDDEAYFKMIDEDIYAPYTEPDGIVEIPLVKIEPIKRRRRVAMPMRDLLLRRRALKSGYKHRRYCCSYRCNDTWKWITKRQVFRDFE